jgi:hypothetical protein
MGNITQTFSDGSSLTTDAAGNILDSTAPTDFGPISDPNATPIKDALGNPIVQKVGSTIANKALGTLLAPATKALGTAKFKPVSSIPGATGSDSGGGGGNQYPASGGWSAKKDGIGGASSSGFSTLTQNLTLQDGSTNTGSGGSGSDQRATGYTRAGNGGSGVVVLAYLGGVRASGGTITTFTLNGYTYTSHTFTSSGTFTA